jgi:ATP-binding cassette subfamily B protein
MIRLVKYLKPFALMILVTIVLLFIQANCDLALPDYLSKIVNTGIQQNGVETAVPQAIRKSEMDRVVLFLSDADKSRVLSVYTLVDASSPTYAKEVQTYPALASQPIYVLKSVSQEEINELSPLMGRALLAVSTIESAMADPAKIAAMGKSAGFDLSKLPEGTDLFTLLAQLPAAQRQQMQSAMNKQFTALGDSMVNQAAVRVVKAEYQALGMDTGKVQNGYILRTGLVMLGISLLSVICAIAVGFLSARTAAGLSRDLRKGVFEKVERFSSTEFDRFSTASLITRTTNDITQIQMVVIMMMRMIFYAPIMGVGGIIRAISKDTSMWWIIAVGVAILLSLVVIVFSLTLPKFKLMQSLVDRLNRVVRENLAGMMVIRAFNMQPFELKRFAQANQDLAGTTLFVSRVMASMFPLMMLIMNGMSILILWIGSHQVAESHMQVGDMMAFMQYAMQIVFSFLMMSFMFIILPRASVSGRRIVEVLETEPSIRDPQQARPFPDPFKGTVEFRNVSFRYPGANEDVLHGISFIANPGQPTALIGSTGSGKSTVVHLIPRFYDVTRAASWWMGWTSVRSPSMTCAIELATYRRRVPCFPGRSRVTCATLTRTPARTFWRKQLTLLRQASLSTPARKRCRPRSPRVGRTYPAGRNSASPSRGRWSNARRSISSTIVFRPSTSRPTRLCAAPCTKRYWETAMTALWLAILAMAMVKCKAPARC